MSDVLLAAAHAAGTIALIVLAVAGINLYAAGAAWLATHPFWSTK